MSSETLKNLNIFAHSYLSVFGFTVGVVFGVLWCGLLLYVMTSLNWKPGGDINIRSLGKQQKVFDTLNDHANKVSINFISYDTNFAS